MAAHGVDGSDAGDAFEPVDDLLVDDPPGLDRVQVAQDADLEDGHLGRVELPERRPVDVLGQAPDDPVEPLSDVVGGRVQVRPPVEGDPDRAAAFR